MRAVELESPGLGNQSSLKSAELHSTDNQVFPNPSKSIFSNARAFLFDVVTVCLVIIFTWHVAIVEINENLLTKLVTSFRHCLTYFIPYLK